MLSYLLCLTIYFCTFVLIFVCFVCLGRLHPPARTWSHPGRRSCHRQRPPWDGRRPGWLVRVHRIQYSGKLHHAGKGGDCWCQSSIATAACGHRAQLCSAYPYKTYSYWVIFITDLFSSLNKWLIFFIILWLYLQYIKVHFSFMG